MTHRIVGALIVTCLYASLTFAQAPAPPPDVAAPPADATRTATGLATKQLEPGKGERKVVSTDLLTAHYTLWTTAGKIVDTTRTKNVPARFPLVNVIPGWQECVMLMTVGEKRRCWIPQALAYNGQKGRPAGMLVADIELIDARYSPTIPPPDVAKPPDDAEKTSSGL